MPFGHLQATGGCGIINYRLCDYPDAILLAVYYAGRRCANMFASGHALA